MREEMQKKKDTEMGKNDSNIEESTENVKGDNESNNDGKQEKSNDVSVNKNGMFYCLYIPVVLNLFYSMHPLYIFKNPMPP